VLLQHQPIAIRRHNLFLHKPGMEPCIWKHVFKDCALRAYHWQKAPSWKNSPKTTYCFQPILNSCHKWL